MPAKEPQKFSIEIATARRQISGPPMESQEKDRCEAAARKAPASRVGNMPNRAMAQPPAKPPAMPTQIP
ncbi:hypothetical protein MPOCJGCO_2781 [Methylobacterium trifolii]|uniref:Uncharacterized protein n=1 Tax=Methylobacterium trifolii TaxID=1003092 RepID=A0ABQ4U2U1_9HYPH|nr:hypothetical protein MPOCJGCO_2781 [Methylobacterium trifolii]